MDYTATLEQIKTDLYAQNPARIAHIEGVAECALELKRRHYPEIPDMHVLLAAYMHDFTKEYDQNAQVEILKAHGLLTEDHERLPEKLFHARTAYALAKYKYALAEDICLAVLYHTTGRRGMSGLEKILYLADYIEKNRTHIDCADVRATYNLLFKAGAPLVLEETILYSLDLTLGFLIKKGGVIHTDTIEARNDMLEQIKLYHIKEKRI